MKHVRGTSLPLGGKLVSSLNLPERRMSKAEIARMPIEGQLIYYRTHPLTDGEKQEALEREDRDAYYDTTGEVDAQDVLDNECSDWDRI